MKYGADYAHAWARTFRFGDVSAKSVLMAITNYMDEDGRAAPGLATLAEDTDQSEDTIRRRLRFLEEVGVIVRFKRYATSSGKISAEPVGAGDDKGKGRRIADEIRLNFGATQATIDEARAGQGKSGEAASEISPSSLQGQNTDAAEPVSPSSLQGSSPSTSARASLCEEREESPPYPPPGGFSRDPSIEEDWSAFERAFTGDGVPIGKPSLARRVLDVMRGEERAIAIRAASGYVTHRRSERNPPAKLAAQNFLREPDNFARYAALAAPGAGGARFAARAFTQDWWIIWAKRAAIGQSSLMSDQGVAGRPWVLDAAPTDEERAAAVQVAVDSAKWVAWERHWRLRKVRLPRPDQAQFAWMPSLWPPGSEADQHHEIERAGT